MTYILNYKQVQVLDFLAVYIHIRIQVNQMSYKLNVLSSFHRPHFRDEKNRYHQFVNSQIPRFMGTFYKYRH